ncbi:MAG: DUF6132 family protein [Bacteroidia bacterium]|nr:DUF6132 family protein [Bacteroidia bacterium]
MKDFFTKHWLKFLGAAAGAIIGYLYYYFVGCGTGSCPLTSNPWRMTIYGAVLGLLILDVFKKEEAKNIKNE